MDIANTINLLHVLIIVLPGFFLLRGYDYKTKNSFEYIMFSTLCGILVLAITSLYYDAIQLPENIQDMINHPYVGALILVCYGWLIGRMAKLFSDNRQVLKLVFLKVKNFIKR